MPMGVLGNELDYTDYTISLSIGEEAPLDDLNALLSFCLKYESLHSEFHSPHHNASLMK